MRVVMIEAIERRLADTPPDALLRELADGEALLTTPTGSTRTALISYRQERQYGDPELTLDGEALLSAIASAKQGGLDAFWLDAWCYRFTEPYDHHDFCSTLSKVLESVQAVVWLRRSKAAASGTYGYRLWCTFEAACVEQLGLPVLPAGHELSRRQKALATFGLFAASTGCFGGDGVTDELCFVNFLMYIHVLCAAIYNAAWSASGVDTTEEDVHGGLHFAALAFVWVWFRDMGSLGHQRRLAQNARAVMRTMLRAGKPGTEVTGTPSLLRNLPWLPSYDRRDVMVMCQLLTHIASDGERERVRAAGSALAFSAYAAAACTPAPGDGNPRDLSIGEWLGERGIAADVLATGASRDAAGSEAVATSFELPLKELRRLGWRRLRGSASCCALSLPTGFYIATCPPVRSERGEVWAMNTGAIELLPQYTTHRVWVPTMLVTVVTDLLATAMLVTVVTDLLATVWAILAGTRAIDVIDVGDELSYESSSATTGGCTGACTALSFSCSSWPTCGP